MSFPLSLFYLLYLGLVAIFFLYSFFNLYHLLRFGAPLAVTLLVAAVYLGGAVAALIISGTFIADIDWSKNLLVQPPPGSLPGIG